MQVNRPLQQQIAGLGVPHVARAVDHRSASHRPRALYVWDGDYPWDVRTEKVCGALTAHGYEVHLVARNRRWAPRHERLAEGIVHRMPAWRALGRRVDDLLAFPAFFNPRWMSLLADTVRKTRPDVIIVRDMPLCPTALYIGRRFGIPIMLDMAENAGGATIERYCATHVDRIVVAVEESGERLVCDLGASPEKIDVVSNTPPRACAEHPPRPVRPADAPLEIAYLGPAEAGRASGEMAEAEALLRDSGTLKFRVARIGESGDTSVLARADVVVLAHQALDAWNAASQSALFEFMASSSAVVASDTTPAARIVRTTGAGEVFRVRDAADLARAITRLADPHRCAVAGDAAQRAILNRYHWEQDSAALVRAVSLLARTQRFVAA